MNLYIKLVLNFWKHAATSIAAQLHRGIIVVVKNGLIKSYTFQNVTQISLTVATDTTFWMDPQIDEALKLKAWMNTKLNE
jgi:hypothetical protein